MIGRPVGEILSLDEQGTSAGGTVLGREHPSDAEYTTLRG